MKINKQAGRNSAKNQFKKLLKLSFSIASIVQVKQLISTNLK
jgi:hypothetical protein